jgi:UDP-N-acetylmuramyl-tripeptide synthetase/UDP-N-acetylmuramoyl-tripeptide--D-alanyl-D-alanine ligase
MLLAELFPSAHLPAAFAGLEVHGIGAHSGKMQPGFVYFAVPGSKVNGLIYANEAMTNGAIAVVAESDPEAQFDRAAFIKVADVRSALSESAARFYHGQPETIVAVTGTSGKTSVADFTRQIWAQLGKPAASLGTLGVISPAGADYGSLTTPDPVYLHQTLARLGQDGVTHLAMEASSHGLVQRRLDGVKLSAGAFTNLSRDHLDYHLTLDDYLDAKLRLFDTLLEAGQPAVIDADSDVAPKVITACAARGLRLFTVGMKGSALRLIDVKPETFASHLQVFYAGRSYDLKLPLAGDFQVSNALVAAGLCIATGSAHQDVFAALERLEGAPGRLELVGHQNGAPVFVDYAHKPDALEKVLHTLRPLATRNLVVVFGCGGDRDTGKRPIMGEVAARLADYVIVTDDNPRSEDPGSIRHAILDGTHAQSHVREIGDRAVAIETGIAALRTGDVLLIAGKGHETGQIIGDRTLPFSDVECARMVLKSIGKNLSIDKPFAAVSSDASGPLWTGLGLVAPLEARVGSYAPWAVNGISIDTRTLAEGDLFFAIKGEANDGHDYVVTALEKGAAAAVIDEAHADALAGCGPLYIVHDVLAALQRLGKASRARSSARIIAVTGSVGKTTTKEALRLVFSQSGPTHASVASYNNHWGVPLTLARMPKSTHYGVFEIGMNHAGEITPLVAMVRPHIAIITNVGPVHLEFFDSVDAIADAKAEIFSGLVPGGTAIVNRDIAQYERLREHAKRSPAGDIFSFGEHEEADARLLGIELAPDHSIVEARILGHTLKYRLGAPGKHLAMNSLAVILAARVCGLALEDTSETLASFQAQAGRGQRLILDTQQGPFTVIDESYNANPASMRAALALAGGLPVEGAGRRIAVLGDMLELGADEASWHASLVDDVSANHVDLVFAAGPLMKSLFEALPAERRGAWRETAADLETCVIDTVRHGDIVVVKGSNSSRMTKIVSALKHRFAPRDHAQA